MIIHKQAGMIMPLVGLVVLLAIVAGAALIVRPKPRTIGPGQDATSSGRIELEKFGVPRQAFAIEIAHDVLGSPKLQIRKVIKQKAIVPEVAASEAAYFIKSTDKKDKELGRYPFVIPKDTNDVPSALFTVLIPELRGTKVLTIFDKQNNKVTSARLAGTPGTAECDIPILFEAASKNPGKVAVAVGWIVSDQVIQKVVVLRDFTIVKEITGDDLLDGNLQFEDTVQAGSYTYSAFIVCGLEDDTTLQSDTVKDGPITVAPDNGNQTNNPTATANPTSPPLTSCPIDVAGNGPPDFVLTGVIKGSVRVGSGPFGTGPYANGAILRLYQSGVEKFCVKTENTAGNYAFSGLIAGKYTVKLDKPANCTINSGQDSYVVDLEPVNHTLNYVLTCN